MTNQKKSIVFGLIAILFWSTAATAFKVALQYMDFMHLLLISAVTSSVIFFVLIILRNETKKLRISVKQFGISLLTAFLNPFLYYLVLLKAYSLLPAQIAQPLNYTWPIVLVLLSAIFLKQKLTLKSTIALLVSFAGVLMISSQGKNIFKTDIENPFGVILAAGSSIIWASYWIINMYDTRSRSVAMFYNFTIGALYVFITIFLLSEFKMPDIKGILSAMYVGTFEMGVTFLLWMYALQYAVDNARINNLVYISPFMSLIFISLILKESIYITTIGGLVLIIAGILIQQLSKKK